MHVNSSSSSAFMRVAREGAAGGLCFGVALVILFCCFHPRSTASHGLQLPRAQPPLAEVIRLRGGCSSGEAGEATSEQTKAIADGKCARMLRAQAIADGKCARMLRRGWSPLLALRGGAWIEEEGVEDDHESCPTGATPDVQQMTDKTLDDFVEKCAAAHAAAKAAGGSDVMGGSGGQVATDMPYEDFVWTQEFAEQGFDPLFMMGMTEEQVVVKGSIYTLK
jgi:hypothetical protein